MWHENVVEHEISWHVCSLSCSNTADLSFRYRSRRIWLSSADSSVNQSHHLLHRPITDVTTRQRNSRGGALHTVCGEWFLGTWQQLLLRWRKFFNHRRHSMPCSQWYTIKPQEPFESNLTPTGQTQLLNGYPTTYYCTGQRKGTIIKQEQQPNLQACAAACGPVSVNPPSNLLLLFLI